MVQVIGGRWKPLQYFLKSSVYADVMATCGAFGQCYVKNDSPFPFTGNVTVSPTFSMFVSDVQISAVSLTNGASKVLLSLPVQMSAGAGVTSFFTVDT